MKYLIATILLVTALASQAKVLQHPMVTLMHLQNKSGYESRIISGKPASKGQIPWQAALLITNPYGQYICGGSLIDEEWVLTAAHCVEDAISVDVQLGVTKWGVDTTERLTSRNTQIHEGYNAWLHNDLGLIKLPRKVAVSDTVKPIRLPSRSEGSDPLVNVKVTASGFGATANSAGASTILNFVELTTITNEECANVYGDSILPSSICAVGHPEHSTCSGDSGGPLVLHRKGKKPTLIGVVSFVHIAGCDSGKPSGYGRVSSFLDWINEKTGIAIED